MLSKRQILESQFIKDFRSTESLGLPDVIKISNYKPWEMNSYAMINHTIEPGIFIVDYTFYKKISTFTRGYYIFPTNSLAYATKDKDLKGFGLSEVVSLVFTNEKNKGIRAKLKKELESAIKEEFQASKVIVAFSGVYTALNDIRSKRITVTDLSMRVYIDCNSTLTVPRDTISDVFEKVIEEYYLDTGNYVTTSSSILYGRHSMVDVEVFNNVSGKAITGEVYLTTRLHDLMHFNKGLVNHDN